MSMEVSRSINTSFPKFNGNLPFCILEREERSGKDCGDNPEAYVIDTEEEWNSIIQKIRTGDCRSEPKSNFPLPKPDLQNNTILVYFWGLKPNMGNTFSISRVEAIESLDLINIYLFFENGMLDAISYPYIIASIPKTGHKKIVFNV